MKNWRQGQPLQLDSFAKAAPAALDLHFPRNTFPTQNASKRCLSRKMTSMTATFGKGRNNQVVHKMGSQVLPVNFCPKQSSYNSYWKL